MSKAGKRMIDGLKEAAAIAKGEQPAAAIWHNGHQYVPATERDHWKEVAEMNATSGAFTFKHLGIAHEALARAETERDALRKEVEAAREFVKRHPALSLIDLAEFEVFLKIPAALVDAEKGGE